MLLDHDGCKGKFYDAGTSAPARFLNREFSTRYYKKQQRTLNREAC
jgi:hypothetical protein